MKTVEDVQKEKKGYRVIINQNEYLLAIEIFYKFALKIGDEINEEKFKEIIETNEMYFFDQIALKKLKKMLTVNELSTFLIKEGAKQTQIKTLIDKYKQYKYIDDKQYVKMYIEQKKHIEGPKLINANLKQKGISQDDINDVLNKFDQKSIIKVIIEKRLKSIKNKNKKQICIQLKNHFFQKGFDDENLEVMIEDAVNKIHVDSNQLIKLEIAKLTKKYHLKMNEKELKLLIKQKLYQKGFLIDEIEKLL